MVREANSQHDRCAVSILKDRHNQLCEYTGRTHLKTQRTGWHVIQRKWLASDSKEVAGK